MVLNNTDFLQVNSWQLTILKLPEVSFFAKSVVLPNITVASDSTATMFNKIPIGGNVPVFGNVSVTFLVDSHATNYISILNWISAIGFTDTNQYAQLLTETSTSSNTQITASESDGSIILNDAQNNPLLEFVLTGMVPISLSFPVSTVESGTIDVTYLIATVEFEITSFNVNVL